MKSISEFDICEVDIGFAVNLGTLCQILRGLSGDGRRWWIACHPADALETQRLTIGYGDPGCVDRLNTLYFNLPILSAEMPMAGEDRLIILLDSSVISAVEPGFYMERGRILLDPIADLECFFRPIRQALIERLRQE